VGEGLDERWWFVLAGGAAPLFRRDEDVELIRSFISQAAGTRPSGGGEWGRLSPTRGGERTCSTTAASEEGTACALLIETRAAIGEAAIAPGSAALTREQTYRLLKKDGRAFVRGPSGRCPGGIGTNAEAPSALK